MELKVNDNITIRIEWKGWNSSDLNTKYIQKTQAIAKEYNRIIAAGPRENYTTIIRMEVPHRDLENYVGMADNEHAYNFDTLYQLIARLKKEDDIKAIYVELSDYEKAGREFSYENILYNIMEFDEKENPSLIRLYPYIMEKQNKNHIAKNVVIAIC